MVFAHHVADDAGALARGTIGLKAHLLHGVENAAVHGLEPVADIGQGAADDDRHGIVEIRLAHLVFNVDGLNVQCAGTAIAAAGWWSQGEFGILIVRHNLQSLRERDLLRLPRASRCSGRPLRARTPANRGRFDRQACLGLLAFSSWPSRSAPSSWGARNRSKLLYIQRLIAFLLKGDYIMRQASRAVSELLMMVRCRCPLDKDKNWCAYLRAQNPHH